MSQTPTDSRNRKNAAGFALLEYGRERYGSTRPVHDDLESALTDLITDLRHLAESKGMDWAKVTRRSHKHFKSEKED